MKRELIESSLESDLENQVSKRLKRSIPSFIEANEKFFPNIQVIDDRVDGTNISWTRYRGRLSTFTAEAKVAIPKELSPIVCSKHGWKSIGESYLQCDDCGKIMSVLMPKKELRASFKTLNFCIKKMLRDLTSGHNVDCPWRINSLNIATSYNIPERYKLLDTKSLLQVSTKPLEIDHLILNECEFNDSFKLTLAICGWIPFTRGGDSGGVCNTLDCPLCGRNLNLTLFNEKAISVDFLGEHFSYCPVIDQRYPLWRESLDSLPRKKEKSSTIDANSFWKIKTMIKRMFD